MTSDPASSAPAVPAGSTWATVCVEIPTTKDLPRGTWRAGPLPVALDEGGTRTADGAARATMYDKDVARLLYGVDATG